MQKLHIYIPGTSTYKEDFEYGKLEGEVEFKQTENEVIGNFIFSEQVESDYKINVAEKLNGLISKEKVLLEYSSYSPSKQQGNRLFTK